MGEQPLCTIEEKRVLLALRALFFFLFFNNLEVILALKGIYIVTVLGLPLTALIFFFPLWEFIFFLSSLKKEFSVWLAGVAFFIALLSFVNFFCAFIFAYLFLLILFLENNEKPLIFKVFFVVAAISIAFPFINILLFFFLCLPKKLLRRVGFFVSLKIVSL